MNDKIKRYAFYNIFFLCAFLGMFMVLGLSSYANTNKSIYSYNGVDNPTYYQLHFSALDDARYGIYLNRSGSYNGVQLYQATFYSNVSQTFTGYFYSGSDVAQTYTFRSTKVDGYNFYILNSFGFSFGNNRFSGDVPLFYDFDSLVNYLDNGVLPSVPFDENLKLDSFKVTSWQVGTSQAIFRSKLEVTWSDERISNVQVRIVGTANSPATFEGNASPFKQKFYAQNYVMKNGDVIHFTATPFKSNGEYGESLYYSLVYNDNLPSNWYRKLVNTPYNDNTLTIPYNNVSGQPQSVTLPVDGVTTNNVYKVNYNPVTYEYGDLNLYNIYYSPVVVYPDYTPEEEIDNTQDVVNNTYTTNNYYETTKNFNIDFDVSFGDISGSDIQIGYDNTGNFLNSFGKLISKLSTWVLALFPFLPPIVATSIVVVFGLVVSVAIIVFALKIASVIADFIDAIIPG